VTAAVTAGGCPVALVSGERRMRASLAQYLEAAGFEVRPYERPPRPPRRPWVLLWLTERGADAGTVAVAVQRWLAVRTRHRVVVVTWRPVAFVAALAAHPGRLQVLAPPVFGWQLVDALRSPA
jgi:hypothetical protein